MAQVKEELILEDYLKAKELKHSHQRSEILAVFLGIDRHLTADELYRIAKRRNPSIGYATVYRTLKLLCEAELSRELKFDDGTTRYEHLYEHKHHDHLICTKCGRMLEIVEPEIERLQGRMFAKYGFRPQRHKMELYGVCKKCKRR